MSSKLDINFQKLQIIHTFLPEHHLTIRSQIHHQPQSSCSPLQQLHATQRWKKKENFQHFHHSCKTKTWKTKRQQWLTLKRGTGLSPATDNTIQFSEFADEFISGAVEGQLESNSSAWLQAGIADSTWNKFEGFHHLIHMPPIPIPKSSKSKALHWYCCFVWVVL